MTNIRPYQQSDYEKIKTILQTSDMFDVTWDSETNFASMLETNPHAIQIAELDGQVVGLVIIDQHGRETAFFYRLAVLEQHRGSGVGSLLLQKAEGIACTMGAKEVAVYGDAGNTIVQRFYTAKGYQTTGKKFICMYKTVDKAYA